MRDLQSEITVTFTPLEFGCLLIALEPMVKQFNRTIASRELSADEKFAFSNIMPMIRRLREVGRKTGVINNARAMGATCTICRIENQNQ